MSALRAICGLGLPDCWLAAGFVRNMVWDALHGYAATPLNDIDVIYHDPEDRDGTVARVVEDQIRGRSPHRNWEVRNQAVMHLRNGDAPYLDSADAMSHWPEIETAVGARLKPSGEVELLAPFGTDSLLAGHLTHNPKRPYELFMSRVISKNWLQKWPNLQIVSEVKN
ncbi:MAG: nucleotidyltransferase family protein [Xanthomonadales bacterium]|nr:nucleotidyltransferase family protein [Xanthomonadales bacterium]